MLATDIVMTMNSPCAVTVSYGLSVGSDTVFARATFRTWNSNLPSRTADPAGAMVAVQRGHRRAGTLKTGADVDGKPVGRNGLTTAGMTTDALSGTSLITSGQPQLSSSYFVLCGEKVPGAILPLPVDSPTTDQ